MKKFALAGFCSLFAVVLFSAPILSFAQIQSPPDTTIITPSGTGADAGDEAVGGVLALITRFISWIYTILLSLAVVMILFAAYKYLFGGGGDSVKEAHQVILWAAVAIGVAFLSRGVVPLVQQLLGQ